MKMFLKRTFLLAFVAISINIFAQTNDAISKDQLSGGSTNSIQTAVPFLGIAPDSRGGSMAT